MRQKKPALVVTFAATTDAMAMERICKETGAGGRLIPVPRVISAGCGLAWCADLSCEDALTTLMLKKGITCQDIHHCLV